MVLPDALRSGGIVPAAGVFIALLAGCAANKDVRYVSPQFYAKMPARVAVLPFDNESVDLAAPGLLRGLVSGQMQGRGCAVLADDKVDEGLLGIGITDGGQLRAVSPQKTGETVGADGLVYGVVENFSFIDLGFVLKREVKLHLKLVLASTGETLWEDSGEGLTQLVAIKKEEARRLFIQGVAQKEVENIGRKPLMPEAREAVRQVFMRFPQPRNPPRNRP